MIIITFFVTLLTLAEVLCLYTHYSVAEIHLFYKVLCIKTTLFNFFRNPVAKILQKPGKFGTRYQNIRTMMMTVVLDQIQILGQNQMTRLIGLVTAPVQVMKNLAMNLLKIIKLAASAEIVEVMTNRTLEKRGKLK